MIPIKYKIGLVLSGGGSRGFMHLGVVKALYEKGIYPDVISGVSAGSIAGSLIADGHLPDFILKALSSKPFFFNTNLQFSRFGLLTLKSLHKKLKLLYTVNNIEELKIPLFVAVTNLNTGKIEYKNEGNLIDYVTASSSIPFLFKPVNINGISYVDGGLIDNLPIAPLKNICEKLIIVNLIPMTARTEFKRSVHLMKQVADVMVYHHNKSEIGANDILIEPGNISKYSYFSSKKAEEIFNVGYFYTKEFISG